MENNICEDCRNWDAAENLNFQNSNGLGLCYFINKLKKDDRQNIPAIENLQCITINFITNDFSAEEIKMLEKIKSKMLILTSKKFGCPVYKSKKIDVQKATNGRIHNN
jgi:hypothetical protein